MRHGTMIGRHRSSANLPKGGGGDVSAAVILGSTFRLEPVAANTTDHFMYMSAQITRVRTAENGLVLDWAVVARNGHNRQKVGGTNRTRVDATPKPVTHMWPPGEETDFDFPEFDDGQTVTAKWYDNGESVNDPDVYRGTVTCTLRYRDMSSVMNNFTSGDGRLLELTLGGSTSLGNMVSTLSFTHTTTLT